MKQDLKDQAVIFVLYSVLTGINSISCSSLWQLSMICFNHVLFPYFRNTSDHTESVYLTVYGVIGRGITSCAMVKKKKNESSNRANPFLSEGFLHFHICCTLTLNFKKLQKKKHYLSGIIIKPFVLHCR